MKQLLTFLFLISSFVAFGQYAPSSTKTKFVQGIGLGSKDTSAFSANDSMVVTIGRDSVMYYRYKGYWRTIGGSTSGYVPYTGATTNVDLGSFKLTANKAALDSIQAKSSSGMGIYSNGGTKVADFGGGGGSQWTNYGFAGYDANRASSYTTRSFTDKNYVDSSDGLRVRYTDTAAMLARSPLVNRFLDSISTVRTLANTKGVGTVASIATNNGSGINGGTITTSGTIAADTTILSTKANVTALLLGKQNAINGTGFVKASGTTISYDNSTYLTTSTAASTYVPYSGATMSGSINMGTWNISNVNNLGVTNLSVGGTAGLPTPTTVQPSVITTGISGLLVRNAESLLREISGATMLNYISASPLAGSSSITTVGTLSSGSIPTSLLTGVLPIANGGTGSATQNFVDLTTAQTVGGAKTFSLDVNVPQLNVSQVSVTSNQIFRNSASIFYVNFSGTGVTQIGNSTSNTAITNNATVGGTFGVSGLTTLTNNTSNNQLTLNGTGAIKTGINFANGGTTYGQIFFDNNAPYSMSILQQYSTGSLILGTNNTTNLTIANGGAITASSSMYAQGYRFAYASKSANYTLTDTDDYIHVTANSTITLPTAVGRSGKRYIIKAIGSINITMATTSSQTINGNTPTTWNFAGPNQNIMTVYSDGANWFLENWATGN